jgi:energy-coupling factor transporter ATP-binding protein EcfA2
LGEGVRAHRPLASSPANHLLEGSCTIIKIAGLYFRYKRASQPIFEDFRLEVTPGERLAVLAPSESGKSTLALCLNGLIPRLIKGEFRGRVEVAGCLTDHYWPRDLASRVGVLFQDFEAQLFSTRVDQEVAFGPENLGLPHPELYRRVDRALGLVGLAHLEDRDPVTLSGGQKQLLALAAVLSLEPGLLVLDEPTTDLDPKRVEELLETLDQLCQRENLTLILLGEDLRLARHCSRIILFSQGQVRADGPPDQILRQVDTLRYLGLRPPALPALFHDLGESTLPLTLDEAVLQARGLGWHLVEPGKHRPGEADQPLPRGPEILALKEISFSYPGNPPVFVNLSLGFRKGEITAILGENGSGKTTMLKLLQGLLEPQAGEVWRAPDIRVGFVFQNPDYQLFAEEVWEEVALGPRLLGLAADEVRQRAETALSQVHLLDSAQEDPFSLTKGQRQRLAVAAVLALMPQVIILDEPTTGLDHQEQEDMLALIRELHAKGHTIIMVTHSMWAASRYARRLIVLHRGLVALDGPTREVFAAEERLAACGLRSPEIVQLSRSLGFVALTPEEFKRHISVKT